MTSQPGSGAPLDSHSPALPILSPHCLCMGLFPALDCKPQETRAEDVSVTTVSPTLPSTGKMPGE